MTYKENFILRALLIRIEVGGAGKLKCDVRAGDTERESLTDDGIDITTFAIFKACFRWKLWFLVNVSTYLTKMVHDTYQHETDVKSSFELWSSFSVRKVVIEMECSNVMKV